MPVKWRKLQVSSETFEAAGVFDVDGDGVLDIVTAGFWFRGPDFKDVFPIADNLRRYNDYYDEFSVIPMDIDGDGRTDFVTGGWWGNSLRWKQNPGGEAKVGWNHTLWQEHVLAENTGNVETTRGWDVDGDGEIEIVPNTPGHPLCVYKLARDAAGKPAGKFNQHVIYPTGLGHGLGFGDVDGDGKPEFITPKGILKMPAGGAFAGPWTLSEEAGTWINKDASIPVLVADIDGDGVAELISGGAHSYGLWYFKQAKDASGRRTWTRHIIDESNSQYHDMFWVDIDGDGKPELVTGKRYRAHCGNDPGEKDDIGIYYFKWTGQGFSKQVVSYGPLGQGAGCGIYFALADLRKTGRLDIIAPGKDGLHIFFNEGS